MRASHVIDSGPPAADSARLRIDVDEWLIDVTVARDLLAQPDGLPADQRVSLLCEAEQLWRGPALVDLAGLVDASELDDLLVIVRASRFNAEMVTGLRHDDVCTEAAQALSAAVTGRRSVDVRRLSQLLDQLGWDVRDEKADDRQGLHATPRSVVRMTGTFPVSIYLSDEASHTEVEAAVAQVLDRAGAPVVERDNPISGSWFRRMWAKAGVRELGRTATHALDSRLVLGPDAQVTATLLQHIASVITSLQTSKEVVVRLGAVLVVKVDDQLAVHQLTAAQQFQLDHQPQLAMSPRNILSTLGLPPACSDEELRQ